ncbi:MAG: hypothetical protein NXI09_13340 [Bacteroidetes bacterium]|nr:hypothetical protein [Bacteroidota bacterium]
MKVAFIIGGIIWLLTLYLGLVLAEKKGVSRQWMWFGLHPFSAWIGYLIISKKDPTVACSKCYGRVDPKAEVCKYCRSDLKVPADFQAPNSSLHFKLSVLLGPGILVAGLIVSSFFEKEPVMRNYVIAYWLYESPLEMLNSDSLITTHLGESIKSQYQFNSSQSGEELILTFKVIGDEGNGWVKAFMHNEENIWISDSLRFIKANSTDTIWLREVLEIENFLNDSTRY